MSRTKAEARHDRRMMVKAIKMRDFKYKTTFSAFIRPLVSEEKDKYLAMASLMDVGQHIPDIDVDKNFDLLPIAFNSFVANRVNKNDDVVDTSTALRIFKSFINKPINIEHNRERVVGTILTAGFSEFGTDKSLSEDEVKNMSGPFNVTLGGVIWKVVNSSLADLIENSSDPTSEDYLSISASWELGFDEYHLLILGDETEKNIENAEIISDFDEIEKNKSNLRALGGNGKLENEKRVYRQVINNVLPLGIGLTENPAADVKGVAIEKTKEIEEDKKASSSECKALECRCIRKESENTKKEDFLEENSSQETKNNVTKNEERHMKEIKRLKDITDESLQDLSASVIADIVEEELKLASEEYVAEKQKVDKELEKAQENHEALSEEHKNLQTELEKVKATLGELEKERAEREAEEQFNQRMALLDEKFILEKEDREVIAKDVKDLDEENFSSYLGKMEVLLKNKNRELVEATEKEVKEVTEETEAQASVSEEATEVIEEAVDHAEEEKVENIPTSTEASEESVYDRYRKAFSVESGFDIKL